MVRPSRKASAPALVFTGMLPQRYRILAVLCMLAIAGLVLWFWYEPNYGGGVDEASYFLAAKGLALHGDPAYHSPDPMLFVPENMVEPRPGVYYPIYPIGYPLLAAGAYKIGGAAAAFMVNPIMMLLALVGAFLLARHFLSDLFAAAVMLILATHGAILHFGVAAWSHASDLAFCTWCLYLASLWYRRPAAWKLVVCGLLLGYAVMIRYTEVLLALPVGWLIGWRAWEAWKQRGEALEAGGVRLRVVILQATAAVGASIVAILPLLWFHDRAFGSPFRTGYALTGHAGAFSLGWFAAHAPFAIWTLCGMPYGLFILMPLGMVALGLWRWLPGRQLGFLALAALPTLLLYMAYYWTNRAEPLMYVRFYLTIYPALLIAALMALERVARRVPVLAYVVLGLLVVYASANLGNAPNEERFSGSAEVDRSATNLAVRHLPGDAVIVTDGYTAYSMIYFSEMTVIYPMYYSEIWARERLQAPGPGLPWEFSPIRREEFGAVVAGHTQHELYEMLRVKLLEYARQGRTVALVAQEDLPDWYSYLKNSFKFTPLAQDDLLGVHLWRLEPR